MKEWTDEELRSKIKSYLKETGKTQQDLADFLKVSLQAVRSQMSKARISARTRFAMIPILEKFESQKSTDKAPMGSSPESVNLGAPKEGITPIALAFNSEEWSVICEAAKIEGVTPNQWLQKIIIEDANRTAGRTFVPEEKSPVQEQSPFKAPMSKEEVEEAKYRDVMQYWDEEKQEFVMPWDEERKRRGGNVIYPRSDESEDSEEHKAE